MLYLGAICADAGISISMSEEALKNYFNDLPRLLKSGIFRWNWWLQSRDISATAWPISALQNSPKLAEKDIKN